MVMFPNTRLELYARGAVVRDAEGIASSYNYHLWKTVDADVQPTGGSDSIQEQWGVSLIQDDARVAYVNKDSTIQTLMKAVDKTTKAEYEIRGTAQWPSHTLLLLTPFQGGQRE